MTAPPSGDPTYQYVSTYSGQDGAGQLPGLGGTNGSSFTTSTFSANPGSILKFTFNYVTSDAVGFDYAWAQLQTPSGVPVATLFTAATPTSGDVITPGGSVTLSPASTPIIAGAPVWSPLGDPANPANPGSSGTCRGAGCGFTGWVNAVATGPAAGNYVLAFGVTNGSDTLYDSGLAFAGISITNNIDTFAPYYLASALGATVNPVFQGGTLRMDQPGATYAQDFTLDGSGTNTIDQFGNNSTFSGVFSDATPGTPGAVIIANSGAGGSVIFTGINTYSGGTTISAGTLQLGDGGADGSILGDVLDNGTLAFNRSDVATFAGTISGSGGVAQIGTGTTILTAANTYSGRHDDLGRHAAARRRRRRRQHPRRRPRQWDAGLQPLRRCDLRRNDLGERRRGADRRPARRS